jgi:hypothetical protein
MLFCPRLVMPESRVFAKNGGATTDMPFGGGDLCTVPATTPATSRRGPSREVSQVKSPRGARRRLVPAVPCPDLAHQAHAESAETCLDVYLNAVGWESAANRGFMHGMWGDLAPTPLVGELEELRASLAGW